MKKITLFLALCFMTHICIGQSVHKLLRKGNKLYEDEQYDEAAENYHKALENDRTNIKGKFNLGNASFESEDYDAAIEQFSSSAELADDELVKANSYYNLGNAYFNKAKKDQDEEVFKQSLDAYKNSLRLNPNDEDAKKNLALAQKYILKNRQPPPPPQQQNQQQDQQKQQQQNQQEQQQSQQLQQDPNESREQEAPKDLSKEDAMELLKIINEEEKRVQAKLRKAAGNGKKPKKDW